MIIFKIFLKKLESYLFDFQKMHRAHIFLIKLKSKLIKNKILSIDNVFTIRKKILTQIIMQEKIMKRSREANFDTNHNDEKKIASKFDDRKFKNRSNRLIVSKLAHNDEKFNNSRNFQNRKRSQSARNSNEKKNHCFICDKSNHWKNECFDREKSIIVEINAIESKNDRASSTSRKRSKKNQ